MKIYREMPTDGEFYYQWMDNNGVHDIWYSDTKMVFDCEDPELPPALAIFLKAWRARIEEYRKTFIEPYTVKLARILAIYDERIFTIYPAAVGAVCTHTVGGEEFVMGWDALFEAYEYEIREDMKDKLGIVHSKYLGFLD